MWGDLISDMRQADEEEWEAADPRPFRTTLAVALSQDLVWYAVAGGFTLAAWGVNQSSRSSRIGDVWLVATNEALRYQHSLHYHWRSGLKEVLAYYPVLHAWAHVKNAKHHEWLRRMGFTETSGRMYLGEREEQFNLFTYDRDE